MKRVATLYRVSTKGQLDENDIPMQRKACHEFINNKTDWKVVKEYTEKGVSGYKVAASKRDVIQQAKEDAENGVFDILLVFMFDRLGRKDDETPFVLEWFVNKGIEMWSVIEGQQKIEQHTDRLINYIRFWQSSGESIKTSIRVNEKHSQMVEEGIFRGGGIPYGYTAIDSGATNKKGKNLLKLIIDEEESEVVKTIYRLVYEEGYGQLRIAKYINKELKIQTRNNKPWSASTINVILKNPIYKGVMRYRGKKEHIYSDEIPELKIIENDVWEYVQKMRSSKNTSENKTEFLNFPLNTKGKLLLIGLARCGVCHSRMTSTYFTNKYKLANGEIKKYNKSACYRCSGKLQGKNKCNGQSTFSANKIEKVVLKHVEDILSIIENNDYTTQINKLKGSQSTKDQSKIKNTEKKVGELEKELTVLSDEVTKSLLGKSSFKPELLNNLIENKTREIEQLRKLLSDLVDNYNKENAEIKRVTKRLENIPIWKEVFKGANNEKKRIALNEILECVYVSKDTVELEINGYIQELIDENNMLN
jgi:DNA invertase Pin-like site-specific DNA recombinase